jgi:hypothetical protein
MKANLYELSLCMINLRESVFEYFFFSFLFFSSPLIFPSLACCKFSWLFRPSSRSFVHKLGFLFYIIKHTQEPEE